MLAAVLVLHLLLGAGTASAAIFKSQGEKVIRTADNYTKSPYKHGGTTPKGFDCSGYTQYVYKKALGKKLPRTAGGQLKYKSVAKSKKRKGDLIIFMRGGRAYHVGLYTWRARSGTRRSPGRTSSASASGPTGTSSAVPDHGTT